MTSGTQGAQLLAYVDDEERLIDQAWYRLAVDLLLAYIDEALIAGQRHIEYAANGASIWHIGALTRYKNKLYRKLEDQRFSRVVAQFALDPEKSRAFLISVANGQNHIHVSALVQEIKHMRWHHGPRAKDCSEAHQTGQEERQDRSAAYG